MSTVLTIIILAMIVQAYISYPMAMIAATIIYVIYHKKKIN